MKLIDLLVQELPKRGGWPEGADSCRVDNLDSDSITVSFCFTKGYSNGFDVPFQLSMTFPSPDHNVSVATYYCMITRDLYESALAASQKPAWNGEGLPPVGAKVEFFINPNLRYSNDWIPDVGTEMEVVAHKTTTHGNDVAVCYWDEDGAGRSCCSVPESLKPLRTEAEKKHEAVLESICAVLEMVAQDYKREDEARLIYEAIAAGKIPGVKLND